MTKIFPVGLYDTKVQFIVTKNAKRYVNNLYRRHNIKDVYNSDIAGVMFTMEMNMYRIIIDENFLSYNTIIHELFHCIMAITYDRIITDEEARAWLIGDLGQKILRFLQDKNIKL